MNSVGVAVERLGPILEVRENKSRNLSVILKQIALGYFVFWKKDFV